MGAKWFSSMVATGLMAAALLTASPAPAGGVAVVVVPPFAPGELAARGAVGEFVPGAGETVSRAAALAALETGKVRNSALGGKPTGRKLIHVAKHPAAITIYVSLPPPGRHANDRRYPIAILGAGYRGILTSGSTRIRGLVSIVDIAPTALALEGNGKPRIRAEPDTDPVGTLRTLETRLGRTPDARLAFTLLIVAAVVLLALVAVLLRSRAAARASCLAAQAVLAGALLASALGITSPWASTLLAVLAILAAALVAALASDRRSFAAALLSIFVVYLVVTAAWPEVNSLSVLGPHPAHGTRFYGMPNLVETILVTPALLGAALLGRASVPAALVLALATVGPSGTGADGGGVVVFSVGLLVLGLLLSGRRATPRTILLVLGAAATVTLALFGLDAALGGSSHVTHALGGGPGTLAGDFARRMRLSWANVTNPWAHSVYAAVAIGFLAWLVSRRPLSAVRISLTVAVGVSLLVNDSPVDVLTAGAVSCGALWSWEQLAPADAAALE